MLSQGSRIGTLVLVVSAAIAATSFGIAAVIYGSQGETASAVLLTVAAILQGAYGGWNLGRRTSRG